MRLKVGWPALITHPQSATVVLLVVFLLSSVRRINCSASLNLAKNRQEFRGGDLCYRTRAEWGKIFKEYPVNALGVGLRPMRLFLLEPFRSYGAKAIGGE